MLRDLVTRSNIFAGEGCGRQHCGACHSAVKPVNCRRRGIVYQTWCSECVEAEVKKALYVGESARSGSERMGEHLADAECGRKDSHISKHWTNQHQGRQTRFNFEIIGFFSTALERQIAEAVRILRTGAERILNSRGEYNRCSLPRLMTKEDTEEVPLGDQEPEEEDQDDGQEVQGEDEPKSKKLIRLEKMMDCSNGD